MLEEEGNEEDKEDATAGDRNNEKSKVNPEKRLMKFNSRSVQRKD